MYTASETFIYNFPYFLVPWAYGLGAPTIILDTDIQGVPQRQPVLQRGLRLLWCRGRPARWPSATAPPWSARHGSRRRLCGMPAVAASGVLLVAGDRLFAILLGPAAVMPPATTPIIIMLLAGNLAQMVSHSVLVHTGYFKDVARISFGLVAAMTGVAALTIWAHFDIVQFLNAFAAVYTCGALVDRGLDDPRTDPARTRHWRNAHGGDAMNNVPPARHFFTPRRRRTIRVASNRDHMRGFCRSRGSACRSPRRCRDCHQRPAATCGPRR